MKIQCPSCHNNCEYPNNFCTFCGFPLPQIEICQNCGSKIDADNAFCTYCGTPKTPKNSQPYLTNQEKLELEPMNISPKNVNQAHTQPHTLSPDNAQKENKNSWAEFWDIKRGRISRRGFIKESVYIIIATIIIFIIVTISKNLMFPTTNNPIPKAAAFILFFGFLAILVRMAARVHDINLSAWYLVGYYILVPWILSSFNPKGNTLWFIIFSLPVIILMIKPSYPYQNKWGNPPEN